MSCLHRLHVAFGADWFEVGQLYSITINAVQIEAGPLLET